ncbi:Pol polyprotein [Plakobranchus ocellatus]|uniref:Pol polyprotein n=1 Tax=Plakobranchus ocellatus TaxID=259542 RepID=A0AAV4A6P1_9GAST|nr:Pol polyprotein [Plakobranchus ocellatus]
MNGLGENKPSELMFNMLSLLGQHQPYFLFKQIFLQQLPDHVRTPLSVSAISDYRTLAREADKLFLAGRLYKYPKLTQCRNPEPQLDAVCWYHHKYGDKAKKCMPSCPSKTYDTGLIIADVKRPLLGADFFRRRNLLMDLNGQRLIEADSYLSSPCSTSRVTKTELAPIERDCNKFCKVLQEFPALLQPTFSSESVRHGIQHYIATSGPPVHSRARRLAPDKVAAAKKEFFEMEKMGIVRKSNSPWASPLHIVPKPNCGWRPCGDYRRLNNSTTPERYLIPHIHDFDAQFEGKTIFPKIHLVRGYHQIPMHPKDIPKTAIITPIGLYEYLHMPFGLKNATQTFQRLMDSVLQGLSCAFVYLDGILVASSSEQQHLQDLRLVCSRLQDSGLAIKLEKCLFGQRSLDFLGHQMSQYGSIPLPSKVKAIRDFPKPSTVKGLQEFLGMVNFYHRFIPHVTSLLLPLHCALQKSHSQKVLR